jgi:hypothetical protein
VRSGKFFGVVTLTTGGFAGVICAVEGGDAGKLPSVVSKRIASKAAS